MSDTYAGDEPEDPAPVETVDLTDPVRYQRSRDLAKRAQQEEDSFWRSVFNDKIGRRVMWQLLQDDCGGFNVPFKCGPNGFPQPEATWFAAGQYSIGQRLYQRWLMLTRAGIEQMHAEHDPRYVKAKAERRRVE